MHASSAKFHVMFSLHEIQISFVDQLKYINKYYNLIDYKSFQNHRNGIGNSNECFKLL